MENVLLSEKEVEEKIREYLLSEGFKVEERQIPQGTDIVATDKEGNRHFIEVEGNKKPNGNPLATSQKYTHFFRAVGQICSRMKDEGTYALGLPHDKKYLDYMNKISTAKEKLNLKIFLVTSNEIKII